MTYIPMRTGVPVIDRNFRDIADALAETPVGAATTTTVISGGSTPSGSSVVNWGVETGVGAAGVTVTFASAFSDTSYVPAYTAKAGEESVMCDVQILSATQMKLVPIGLTGVEIRWSAIGS